MRQLWALLPPKTERCCRQTWGSPYIPAPGQTFLMSHPCLTPFRFPLPFSCALSEPLSTGRALTSPHSPSQHLSSPQASVPSPFSPHNASDTPSGMKWSVRGPGRFSCPCAAARAVAPTILKRANVCQRAVYSDTQDLGEELQEEEDQPDTFNEACTLVCGEETVTVRDDGWRR